MKPPMTEIERLNLLVNSLEGGNSTAFAKRIGVSLSVISRIRSGKLTLAYRRDAILRAYPIVNREWLETGDGYPGDLTVDLTRNRFLKIIEEKDKIITNLSKEIDMQRNIIEKWLKSN